MISGITTLNTEHSGLEAVLPSDHTLDTDSNLVLAVGPNGSGKTALLRLIYTALSFKRYYDEHGISRWQQFYGFDNERLQPVFDPDYAVEDAKIRPSLYQIKTEDHTDAIEALSDGRLTPKLESLIGDATQRDDEYFDGSEWKIGRVSKIRNIDSEWWEIVDEAGQNCQIRVQPADIRPIIEVYRVEPEWTNMHPFSDNHVELVHADPRFSVNGKISTKQRFGEAFMKKEDYNRLRSAKEILQEPTDFNIWGNGKLNVDGNLPYHILVAPVWGQEVSNLPSGAEDRIAGVAQYGEFAPHKRIVEIGGSDSIGLYVWKKLQAGLDSVDRFFNEGKIEDYISLDFFGLRSERGYIDVADDASLVLMLEEPTEFLDPVRRLRFRQELESRLEQYGPRLQVFVATNDLGLIEGLRDYKSISFYDKPASSGGTFDAGEVLKRFSE